LTTAAHGTSASYFIEKYSLIRNDHERATEPHRILYIALKVIYTSVLLQTQLIKTYPASAHMCWMQTSFRLDALRDR
jgi:hypothetical protein